jgi:hypothetical protein
MKRLLILPLFMLLLNGCVAVWGGAHKVIYSDSEKFVVQYDPAATSSIRGQVLARKHCESFGKKAEGVSSEMPGILLGIIEDVYICK